MADNEKVSVPGWLVRVVPIVVSIIVSTVGLILWADGRYVGRPEWERMEVIEAKEGKETAEALNRHISDTRLDAARLATIEAQLAAIREDLAWFKHRIEREGKPK